MLRYETSLFGYHSNCLQHWHIGHCKPNNSLVCPFHKVGRKQRRTIQTRSVTRGNLHIMKDYLAQSEKTIQGVLACSILVVKKEKSFRLWVFDVKLTYLRSCKSLTGKTIITSPAPEFELSLEIRLDLIKPTNGLAELGSDSHRALDNQIQKILNRTLTIIDPSEYYQTEND